MTSGSWTVGIHGHLIPATSLEYQHFRYLLYLDKNIKKIKQIFDIKLFI